MIRDLMQQPSLDALAWTLIHFLWQGALLGIIAFAVLRLARPQRAATRYIIGVTTLGLMLVTCAATFTALVRDPNAADRLSLFDTGSPTLSTAGQAAVDEVDEHQTAGLESVVARSSLAPWRPAPLGPSTLTLVVSIWALGVLALSLRLLGGWLLTRQLAHGAVAAVSPSIEAAAKQVAARLQLRRVVAIVESGAVSVPTLVGWVKPVVLLPAAALSGLTPEQLQAILAHELAHVRRHDYLVNLLQSVVETLLFYHPAMWWVSAQVRAEREHCCDDLAVDVCGDRLVYVSALAELTTMASDRRLALAATDGSLVARVQRILGRPRSMHEPTPAWALLALFVLIAGSVGSFGAASAETSATPIEAVLQKTAAPVEPSWKQAPPVKTDERAREVKHAPEQPLKTRETLAPPPPPPPPPPEAPKAPYAPEAPLAPQSPSSSSGNMSWSNNGEKVNIKWTGTFRLSDDEKDIASIEDGGRLSISDGILSKSSIDVRGVNGKVERSFWKNGLRREYEPEGRVFLAAALDKLIRHSGVFARDRVARFLTQGGPDAVLAEITRLSGSSYVRRIYYTELAKQAELSEPLVTRILQRVPSELGSDYDKATLLIAMAKLPAITEAHRVLVARAVGSISSDYDQRRTLAAIMDVRPLPAALAAAVLEAASSITSNYDRSLVLRDLIDRGGLTPATSPAFMNLVNSMGSSYDKRRVLSAVSAGGAQSDAVTIDVIKSAGAIASAYDSSETLLGLLDRNGLSDGSANAFFAATSKISSSHDLSRVLRRVMAQTTVSERILEGVLRTAARISSSHDRANLLEAVATRAKVMGTSRELYLSATHGMGSHDENRALAALVRAERR